MGIQDFRRSSITYDAITLEVSAHVTDLNIKDNTELFNKIEVARELVFRNTDPVAVRLNSISNAAIDLLEGEGINMSGVPISNIYLSTGDRSSLIRIWILGWN
jgi:hypothetical protein